MEAFPIQAASAAVDALNESWRVLTARPRTHFHQKLKEPVLTRVLKTHLERVTARQRGLLGMWAAENVINTMDFETGQLTEERRTDIVYGWNNTTTSMQLVFEFKKLSKTASSRKAYTGSSGLGRFVTGIYSPGQPVAAMVGMLMHRHEEVVPPLMQDLDVPATVAGLRLVQVGGKSCRNPSSLFSSAEFDTCHQRPPELAPSHGTIQVAHLFFAF